MNLGMAAALLVVLALFVVHRQAARRMLTNGREDGAEERGLLDVAIEIRPVLIFCEVVVLALAVLVASQTDGIPVVARAGLLVLVMIGGLLVPLPRPADSGESMPAAVNLLVRIFGPRKSAGADETPRPESAAHPLDERVLLDRMVRFQEAEIDEVMVPRSEVIAVERNADVSTLMELIEEHRHSRYPVFENDVDQVVGFVNVFELLKLPPGSRTFDDLVRPAHLVPEGKACHELLAEMYDTDQEFAVVIDEYGGTAGVVTAEDLVEELVGEIWDEHEQVEVMVRRVGRDVYVCDATTPLGELQNRLGLELPEGDYETLAGFLLDQFGRIPVRGDRVEWREVEFEVLQADRRRIVSVQVSLGRAGGDAR